MDIAPVQEAVEKISKSVMDEIDGCDAVSITLMEGEIISTSFCTSADCEQVDQVQYANGTGPCIDSMRLMSIHATKPLSDEDRWPEYAKALREHGYSAVLAAPLELSGVAIGALNLYSRSVEPFPAESLGPAAAYATQIGYAIDYAKLYERAAITTAQLEEALKSRAVIDQAMGILMEREGVGSKQAFEMLRTASQHSNVKLREIARRIVDETETQAGSKTSN